MKTIAFMTWVLLIHLFFAVPIHAQQSISFDIGFIRQKNHHNGGLNVSSFYHFNHQLLGGIEVNRFFPVHRTIEGEAVLLSGWDVEMNLHYLLPVGKSWKFYPITGISHTSEKELNTIAHDTHYEKFWSVNTGVGIYIQAGHWLPHAEYIFSWGHVNQQFFLFGAGYEIEWGHHNRQHTQHKKTEH